MKIFGSPGSPFVRKVRVIAAEKDIPAEYVIERPNLDGSRIPALNPLGKIPVLVLESGEAYYDSVVIGEYLDGSKPQPRLVPADFTGRMAVKRFEALADGLAELAVIVSHDLGPMHGAQKQAEWLPRQMGRIDRTLGAFERNLGREPWLHAGAFSLADICAGYALFYLDQVLASVEWRRTHPGLSDYAARLAERASFRDTVPAAA